MKKKETVILGLGSNLGDRLKNIKRALRNISKIDCLELKELSSLYQSEAIGPKQRDFYNMVIAVEVDCSPEELLNKINNIERDMGRIRKVRWGERNIDIDILLFGKHNVENENLIIPHPRLIERRFVLEPLQEIAQGKIDLNKIEIEDNLKKTKSQKIKKIADPKDVWPWKS